MVHSRATGHGRAEVVIELPGVVHRQVDLLLVRCFFQEGDVRWVNQQPVALTAAEIRVARHRAIVSTLDSSGVRNLRTFNARPHGDHRTLLPPNIYKKCGV